MSHPSLINEIGNRYGKLTVIERAENSRSGNAAWLCQCDCGQTTVAIGYLLRRGDIVTCGSKGCKNTRALAKGQAAFNSFFTRTKRRALKRGYIFELSKSQVREIISKPCFYCGIEPFQRLEEEDLNGSLVYNGIDRFDNEKGYVVDNVVPCCGVCNRAKYDLTPEEFKAWSSRLFHNWGSK